MLLSKKIIHIMDFWVRNAKINVLKKNVSTVQLLSNYSADDFILV